MYAVQIGYNLERTERFETFAEALAYYRGYCRGTPLLRPDVRLVNPDNIDGAEDASVADQHGLTRSEWEQVEAVV